MAAAERQLEESKGEVRKISNERELTKAPPELPDRSPAVTLSVLLFGCLPFNQAVWESLLSLSRISASTESKCGFGTDSHPACHSVATCRARRLSQRFDEAAKWADGVDPEMVSAPAPEDRNRVREGAIELSPAPPLSVSVEFLLRCAFYEADLGRQLQDQTPSLSAAAVGGIR